jgi:hypothetical protein
MYKTFYFEQYTLIEKYIFSIYFQLVQSVQFVKVPNCQNLMFFHQNVDGNMMFRYSYIIIDHQIDDKISNFNP